MEPLASLNSVTPVAPPVQPRELAERDSPQSRAPERGRDVVLRSDHVDQAERPTPEKSSSKVADQNPMQPPGIDAKEKLAERLAEKQRETRDDIRESVEETRADVTVRYRVRPHSPGGVQAQIIDRDTDEVIRSNPTDERIELLEDIQRHLGKHIDLLA